MSGTYTAVVFIYSEISHNTASGLGGGIHLPGASNNLIFHQSTITGNIAAAGAAVYIGSTSSVNELTISASNVTHNTALLGAGGGFYVSDTSSIAVNVTDSTLCYNTALTSGGFFYMEPLNSSAYIISESNYYYNNTATDGGERKNISDDKSDLIGSYFLSSLSGVASYMRGFSDSNSIWNNNTASNTGGGISVYSILTMLLLSNSQYNSNQASQGGSMSIITTSNVELSNTFFSNNYAKVR